MNRVVLFLVVALCAFTGLYAQTPTSCKLTYPAGGEKFRPGTTQDIKWDTAGTFRARWRFQFASSATGPWTDLAGLTSVLDSANRRGQFLLGWRVPAIKTSTAYIRMVLVNSDGTLNESVQDVNDAPFQIDQPASTPVDSVLSTAITSTVTLSNTKVYGIDGYVYVDNGGVLRIDPGTIVVGDTVGQNSAICVNRGGKIYANGTKQLPIVLTSSAPPGQRAAGDWGGVLICGKAKTNHPGGQAALEGGIADNQQTRGWFGGDDDEDSSGVLRYVRVEFAGIAAAPNSELNSFTFGGVGRRTVVEYCQASFGNDDSFEWFGGTLNCRYLVANGGLDDDFDGDNGWRGRVQFAVAQRHRNRADQSTSQTFEMDNDANATYNQPLTAPIFSNVTSIGPLQDTAWVTGNGITPNTYNSRFGASAQIRRNARTSIFNSVFVGWTRGVEIANANTMLAASNDSIQLRNNSWYGIKGSVLNYAGGTPPTTLTTDWLATAAFGNIVDKSSAAGAKLDNPFATNTLFNAQPEDASPVLTGASFQTNGVVNIGDSYFQQVSYRGAFGGSVVERWDLGWTEFDPQVKEYKAQTGTSVEEKQIVTAQTLYPNPASTVAVVRYNLAQDSRVSIAVYNALGEIVATVAENLQQRAETYEFSLNTATLSNGSYMVAIRSANGTTTLPLSVLR